MDNNVVEVVGITINVKSAYDQNMKKDRLLVCIDDVNEVNKGYIFVDELIVGNTTYVSYDTQRSLRN